MSDRNNRQNRNNNNRRESDAGTVSFCYGGGVLTLPAEVCNRIGEAELCDWRVLMALGAGQLSRDTLSLPALAAASGCTQQQVSEALAFWSHCGVIQTSGQFSATGSSRADMAKKGPEPEEKSDASEPAAPAAKPLRRAEELPDYSTEELTALLERRGDLILLLDECQRAWGKIFNTHEVNVIIGIIDYLGFDGEYLLLLLTHCAKMNYPSLHSVERLAFRMREEDIGSAADLQERLLRMERAKEHEGMVRSLFGLGSRSLTEKEKRQVELWFHDYGFGEDMIRRAYEITVDRTGKASVNYAGGILKNWKETGIRTPEEADRAEEVYRASHAASPSGTSKTGSGGRQQPPKGGVSPEMSSMGDDFWETALRASYGENYESLGFGGGNSDPAAKP